MNPRGTNPSGTPNMGQGRTGQGQQGRQGGDSGAFQHARDAVTETASQVKDKIQDTASAVADRAGETWQNVKDRVGEGYDTVTDYASTGWGEFEHFVRRHPVTCCAIAFGLGMLACSLIPSRTHDIPRRMERASY